jgi:hypothetical protein
MTSEDIRPKMLVPNVKSSQGGQLMPDDPEQGDLAKFEAEARDYAAAKSRERMGDVRMATTRTRRSFDRPNPPKAHDQHREEQAADQQKRLRSIDPAQREQVVAQVEKHYKAWGRALNTAYNKRYDNSDRLYERKLAARKTDERLIPRAVKAEIRGEAIREAVTLSNNRIKEINAAIPQMIDRAINDAVKLSPARKPALDKSAQRAKDMAADYEARVRQMGKDRGDKDRER